MSEIIRMNRGEFEGNTMQGAAFAAFEIKDRRDIKFKMVPRIVEVLQCGEWVSYDWWLSDKGFCFLRAE